MRKLLALLLFIVAMPLLAGDDGEKLPFKPGLHPRRLVMVQIMWFKGSEAVLVDDQAEVQKLYDLMAGNSRALFACGYHWNVMFETEPGVFTQFTYNQECEQFSSHQAEINAILHRYIDEALHRPKWFASRVTVPVTMTAEKLEATVESPALRVVELDPPTFRFPSLLLTATVVHHDIVKADHMCTERLRRADEALRKQFGAAVAHEPWMTSASGDELSCESAVYFPAGVDRAKLGAWNVTGVKRGELQVPATYDLYVIAPKRAAAIAAELQKAAPEIVKLDELYPEEKPE